MKYPFLKPLQLETVLFFLIMALIIPNQKKKPANDTIKYFILFFISIAISLPFAFDKSIALDTIILWIKTSLVFFIYLVCIVDEERKLNTILIVYMLCVFLIIAPPFWDAINGIFPSQGDYGLSRAADLRSNIYGNANTLGMIAVSTLPFSFNYFRYYRERRKKLLEYLMLGYSLMLSILVILTGSRTAFLGLLLFGFLMIIRSKNRMKMFAVLMVIFFIFMGTFGSGYRGRLLSTLNFFGSDKVDRSIRDRKRMLKSGIELFIKRPITGYGAGCFAQARLAVFRDTPRPAHSLYALLISELGMIGVVAFFLLMRSTFRNLRFAKGIMHKLKMEKELLYYQTLMIFDYLVIRLFVGFMAISLYANYWAMAAAFSVVIYRLCSDKECNENNGLCAI